MAVNSDSIVKSFNIFENKAICLTVIHDLESVESFSFNQSME